MIINNNCENFKLFLIFLNNSFINGGKIFLLVPVL